MRGERSDGKDERGRESRGAVSHSSQTYHLQKKKKKKTGTSEKGKVYVSAGLSRWEKMKLNNQQTLLHLN